MSTGTELVVSETSVGDGVTIHPSTSSRLAVDGGDALSLVAGSGVSTAAVCATDEAVDRDGLWLDERITDRLNAAPGDRLVVETVSPATAEHLIVAPVLRLGIRGGGELVRDAIGARPVSEGDKVDVSLFRNSLEVPFRVLSTRPSGPVIVGEETVIETEDGPAPTGDSVEATPLPPTAIGGYQQTVDRLRAVIADGTGGTRSATDRTGVLLAGPHGVGKTHLLRHAAWHTDATIEPVDPGTLSSRDYESVVERLRTAAAQARGTGRGIVHLPAVGRLSDDGATTAHAIRSFLDDLRSTEGVVAVAETTDTEAVPTPLVQGTRLSRTIEVPEPSASDRGEILQSLAQSTQTGPDADLSAIGRRAFGYVAADLVALWNRARDESNDRARESPSSGVVSGVDLERALEATEPSGVRNATADVPSLSFDDIGGLADAKRELTRAVEWPLTRPALFESLDIDAPAGVLLYGPPGTGKTMLAQAVASTTAANFLAVDGPELLNKYVGESERAVRRVFDRARSNAPTVVFFDEIDALGSGRSLSSDSGTTERVVSQLLTELDGLEGRGQITVIGATNRPDRLDEALLRPGRFDRTVAVPLPDEDSRAEIFEVHARDRVAASLNYDRLARKTDGYSGSDIAAVVREAGLLAIEDRIEEENQGRRGVDERPVRIRHAHVERALESVGPSLSGDDGDRYSLD